MLEWMMVLGYRQNCQNWIKAFISFFCSVCFVVYVYVSSLLLSHLCNRFMNCLLLLTSFDTLLEYICAGA